MSGTLPRDQATRRVWFALPDRTRQALDDLGPSDLQVLLADLLTAPAVRGSTWPVTAGRWGSVTAA